MLSSRQYSSDLRNFFSQHPLMDYPAQVRKSANFHIQDVRHGLICIFKISAQFWGESAWPNVVIEVQGSLAFHPSMAGGHAGFSVVKSPEQYPDSHQACLPRRRYESPDNVSRPKSIDNTRSIYLICIHTYSRVFLIDFGRETLPSALSV